MSVTAYGTQCKKALGAAANAPRLGSVTSGVPSGVVRSPRKVRLLRRAPRLLRLVGAGAADGFGAGVDLNVDRMDESCGLPWRMAWFVQRCWSQRWIRDSTWPRDAAKRSRLRAMMRWGRVLQGLGGEARRALKVDWGSLFS